MLLPGARIANTARTVGLVTSGIKTPLTSDRYRASVLPRALTPNPSFSPSVFLAGSEYVAT